VELELAEFALYHVELAEFASRWMDYAKSLEDDCELTVSVACAWAFDLGLRGVMCHWCSKPLGNDDDAIRAHVALCRQEVKP